MVQVTKGKNVVIETYDAELKEFTATAAQTDFTMANKAGETTPEYTRVYVDNVEVASADITVSSATPAVVAIPACTVGQIVQIYAKGQERRIQRPAGNPDEGINKDYRDSRAGQRCCDRGCGAKIWSIEHSVRAGNKPRPDDQVY